MSHKSVLKQLGAVADLEEFTWGGGREVNDSPARLFQCPNTIAAMFWCCYLFLFNHVNPAEVSNSFFQGSPGQGKGSLKF